MKFKKTEELYAECQNWNYHISITWQKATEFSIDIYKGYVENYQNIFFSDGHLSVKEAVKEGLRFMKNKKRDYANC